MLSGSLVRYLRIHVVPTRLRTWEIPKLALGAERSAIPSWSPWSITSDHPCNLNLRDRRK